jgi:hypothetical protein
MPKQKVFAARNLKRLLIKFTTENRKSKKRKFKFLYPRQFCASLNILALLLLPLNTRPASSSASTAASRVLLPGNFALEM